MLESKLPDWWFGNIPEHMHQGLFLYIQHGIEPGSFLTAILANDFDSAAGRADHINARHLKDYAEMLSMLPIEAWGSYEKVREWISHRGAEGLNNEIRDTDRREGDHQDG